MINQIHCITKPMQNLIFITKNSSEIPSRFFAICSWWFELIGEMHKHTAMLMTANICTINFHIIHIYRIWRYPFPTAIQHIHIYIYIYIFLFYSSEPFESIENWRCRTCTTLSLSHTLSPSHSSSLMSIFHFFSRFPKLRDNVTCQFGIYV